MNVPVAVAPTPAVVAQCQLCGIADATLWLIIGVGEPSLYCCAACGRLDLITVQHRLMDLAQRQ